MHSKILLAIVTIFENVYCLHYFFLNEQFKTTACWWFKKLRTRMYTLTDSSLTNVPIPSRRLLGQKSLSGKQDAQGLKKQTSIFLRQLKEEFCLQLPQAWRRNMDTRKK